MHNDDPFCIVVFLANWQDEKPECLLSEFIEKKMRQYPVAVWQCDAEHTVVLFRGNILGIQEIIRNCVSDISKDISFHISAGIGTSVESVLDCHISFENALLALSYRLYVPDRTVFDNSVICTKAPPLSASRIDTLPLADAICRNDNNSIIAYMEVFFQSVFYAPMPPPGFLKGMCMFLITDIQKTLIKNTGLDQSAFSDSVYAEINRLSSFGDIKKWMTALFLHYSNETMVAAANNKNPFIEKAKQYIESHIESKILAEDVAAAVNLSTSYFTIYFKSKTGENFRDYLLTEKNEYAKKLLFRHDVPINEIAERLGYEDYRSFCRAFKKQEGITPSEYQQQYDIQRKRKEERQD
jgi:two-component system, response regulator YesN